MRPPSRPLALAVIGGLSLATAVTLVIIPGSLVPPRARAG